MHYQPYKNAPNAVDGDDWGQMCFDKLQNKLQFQKGPLLFY